MDRERLDVSIVGFHSRDLVERCLDSIAAASDDLDITVVVADNHSGDGTVEMVQARSDGVRAIAMGANRGFAVANNRAIATGTAPWVMLLNPDTQVRPGALTTLVDHAVAHHDAGVVAPRVVFPDGRSQMTARAFPSAAAGLFGRRSPLTRLFPNNRWSRRFLVEADHDGTEPFTVDWVSGAAMLVPRHVIDEVGGLDEGFFLFWEDADWCKRIKDAGYSVWCVPAAQVVHDEGGARRGWSPDTIRYFHRGALRYWTKHRAPQPWNPSRWMATALLGLRCRLLLLDASLRRRTEGSPA